MIDQSSLAADPAMFFSTAAGPNAIDIYGPPAGVLDMYSNGVPVSQAQSQMAQGLGDGGVAKTPLLARRDVHAAFFLLLGLWMLHAHARAQED